MEHSVSSAAELLYNDLLIEYVAVCNKALQENANRFPFQQILGAARTLNQSQNIEVSVLDWGHRETYIFKLDHQGLSVSPHTKCQDCKCIRSWSVNKDYIERVTENPNAYIENPAKINWEWMYAI